MTLVLASAVIIDHGNRLNSDFPTEQIVVTTDIGSIDSWKPGTPDDHAHSQHTLLTFADKYISAEATFF